MPLLQQSLELELTKKCTVVNERRIDLGYGNCYLSGKLLWPGPSFLLTPSRAIPFDVRQVSLHDNWLRNPVLQIVYGDCPLERVVLRGVISILND